jgi:hypothetical protein
MAVCSTDMRTVRRPVAGGIIEGLAPRPAHQRLRRTAPAANRNNSRRDGPFESQTNLLYIGSAFLEVTPVLRPKAPCWLQQCDAAPPPCSATILIVSASVDLRAQSRCHSPLRPIHVRERRLLIPPNRHVVSFRRDTAGSVATIYPVAPPSANVGIARHISVQSAAKISPAAGFLDEVHDPGRLPALMSDRRA